MLRLLAELLRAEQGDWGALLALAPELQRRSAIAPEELRRNAAALGDGVVRSPPAGARVRKV